MRAQSAAPGELGGNRGGGIIAGNGNSLSLPDLAAQINQEHDLAAQCAESENTHCMRKGRQ